MTKEENKAIEDLKDILKYWQTIVEIEDDVEREIEMNCYSEEMPFEQLKIALNLIEKLKKENEELKNKVVKRDKELIKLEEYANKNFERKDDVKAKYIPKDKIREKIENYQNEIECENSYLEQGIICEEEYKDRVKVYNSYIFILNKLLEEE